MMVIMVFILKRMAFLGPVSVASPLRETPRSMSFWVRMCAGFVALSMATSQALLSTNGPHIADPANPFGHHSQTSIALCIGTGVSGAFFCALSEPAGGCGELLRAIQTYILRRGIDVGAENSCGKGF